MLFLFPRLQHFNVCCGYFRADDLGQTDDTHIILFSFCEEHNKKFSFHLEIVQYSETLFVFLLDVTILVTSLCFFLISVDHSSKTNLSHLFWDLFHSDVLRQSWVMVSIIYEIFLIDLWNKDILKVHIIVITKVQN